MQSFCFFAIVFTHNKYFFTFVLVHGVAILMSSTDVILVGVGWIGLGCKIHYPLVGSGPVGVTLIELTKKFDLGCRDKANCPHVRFGPVGEVPFVGRNGKKKCLYIELLKQVLAL